MAPPSAEAAEALLALLRSGHLGLSLLPGPAAAKAEDGAEDAAGPSALPGAGSVPLGVCLLEQALEDAACEPEDAQQRLWQRQLLAVLRWLAPGRGLDPEQPQSSDFLAGVLCSPRRARAAEAGPGSPRSPRAAGAAAAAASFDAAELYAAVKPAGDEAELQAETPELLPTLRRYQRRAAHWMLSRERLGTAEAAGGAGNSVAAAAGLHPLWRELALGSGRCLYVNPYTGRLSQERFLEPPAVPGVRRQGGKKNASWHAIGR